MTRTTQLQAFKGMMAVQNDYTASGMTDSEFAEKIGSSRAQVTQWRIMLNIPNNAAPTRVSAEQVNELRACLQEADSFLAFDYGMDDSLRQRIKAILEATK